MSLKGNITIYPNQVDSVDATASLPVLTRTAGDDGNEYVYLKGVAGTVAGSVVTFNDQGESALLAASAIGPVAVAQAATVKDTYGWYCIYGLTDAKVVANSAANTTIGRETSDGSVGDGKSAGDEIIGAIQRKATTTAALATIQISYPFVNDKTGL